MNKEEREKQIRTLFDALKANVPGKGWLNREEVSYRSSRGMSPFQGIMRALDTDSKRSVQPSSSDPEKKPLSSVMEAFAANAAEHLAPVEHSSDGADFDDRRRVIMIPAKEEYDSILEYAHDLFTAASLATGTPEHFNRPGVILGNAGHEQDKSELREQLVGELVSAAMCIEEGHAASLAPSSVDTVEEWEKYIADNPEHFDGIIEDVDKAVYALREIRNGRKPDYEKIERKVREASREKEQQQTRAKSQTERKAAERQVKLLTDALLRCTSNGRVWMNPDGKLYPDFYPKGPSISPFNAITLTLFADDNAFRTNLYTTFQEARRRNEGVKGAERGVPFNWYNWNSYVNHNKPDDIISRKAYLELSAEEKKQYKGVHNREIRTLFNLDQTLTPVVDPSGYSKAVGWNGGKAEREGAQTEEKIRHEVFDLLLDHVSDNLVPIARNSGQPVPVYDQRQDVVQLPAPGTYMHYHDYVHDILAEIVRATGHPERLAREGTSGRTSRDEAVREELIVELATGVKMLELGMPARLSSGSERLVEDWVRQLREDPQMIDVLESEVNNASEVISKAELGEKVEYSSYLNHQKVLELQDRQKPQVSPSEGLVLADVIRHHGMALRDENFSTPAEKEAFMEKFSMSYYFSQIASAQALTRSDDPELAETAWEEILNHAASIDRLARELRPSDWTIKGRRDIEGMIHEEMDEDPERTLVIIMDEKTRKADVILPEGAFEGGKVTMPDGQERSFYVTPDEVLSEEEKMVASIRYNEPAGFSKIRIDHALSNNRDFEPSFTRYFNRDGVAAFHADDRYFEGKRLYVAAMNQWSLTDVRQLDIRDKVELSQHPGFERILMMKDDDGRWMLYLQAQDEKPFALYPDKADLNKFFTAAHQGNAVISAAVRQELAVKYYELSRVKPDLKVDVMGEKASEEDTSRIQRVNVFRNKQGQFMIVAKVTDTPRDMPARPITAAQWQRLWLSGDHEGYKRDLAAKVFADFLHPENIQKNDKGKTADEKREKTGTIESVLNPEIMRQYKELKKKHPDAILLFKAGDQISSYRDDARKVASILGISLNRSLRNRDTDGSVVSVAGFPSHALDSFLPRLIRAGERVAVCEIRDVVEQKQAEEAREEQPSRGFRR